MKIVNVIAQVDDGNRRVRDWDKIEVFAVHRVGRILDRDGKIVSNLGRTAEEICDRFLNDPEVARYTGGEIAYTFMIEEDGTIKQCLPIDDIGQHARRWNTSALGVAVVGDFRYEEPTRAQWTALVDLLTALSAAWALDPRHAVRGHDELPGGSRSAGKRCPGRHIDVDSLRSEVTALMRDAGRQRLSGTGLAWASPDEIFSLPIVET